VDDVHPGQPNGVQRHEAFVRHPIAATAHEASHLRQVADEGGSAATPAILAGAVLASVIAIAAIVFLVVYGVVHFW
jgi:DNA primase